jgi:hypothetical protein
MVATASTVKTIQFLLFMNVSPEFNFSPNFSVGFSSDFRITLVSQVSIRHLKNDVHDGCRIHRLPVSRSWFEPHLVRGRQGSFIEPMAQTPDHTIHMQLSVRRELHFE